MKENYGNTENNAKGGLTEKQIRDMISLRLINTKEYWNHIVGNLCKTVCQHCVFSWWNEQTAENGVTKQNDYCLYGQLQNDGSFKVSMSDSRNAFMFWNWKIVKQSKRSSSWKNLIMKQLKP